MPHGDMGIETSGHGPTTYYVNDGRVKTLWDGVTTSTVIPVTTTPGCTVPITGTWGSSIGYITDQRPGQRIKRAIEEIAAAVDDLENDKDNIGLFTDRYELFRRVEGMLFSRLCPEKKDRL